MNREIITNNDPKSPISEIFRTLRTNIQYMKRGDKAQSILLTSTVQGEGKSFIASNLAVTFAQAGKNTIIVDADMRRPRQHKKFQTQMYPGLSNYLSGVDLDRLKRKLEFDDCIYQTEVENLWIMPSGNIPPNPSELLQSEKFDVLMKDLESRFDVIIFDGAPCLAVTDSIIISRFVTHTIIVCSQNSTKIDELKEVKRLILQVGGNIAGVVLNKVKFSKKRLEHSYYYSSNTSLTETKKSIKRRENDEFETAKPGNKSSSIKYNNVWAKSDEKDEYSHNDNLDKEDENEEFSSTKDSEEKQDENKNTTSNNAEGSDKIAQILEQINQLKENNK